MRLRIFFLLTIFLLAISIPYYHAETSAGRDYVFGGFLLNPIDGNTYLAKMYQGYTGEWRFRLPYSADQNQGAYINLYYLFLGHLSRVFSISLSLTFHLARILGAVILFFSLRSFLFAYLPEESNPYLLFALALFGSGVGWLLIPSGAFTSDFWVAEIYPFLSAYANPHFTLGLALMLRLMTIPSRAVLPKKSIFQTGILLSIQAILIALIIPFGIVILLVVLAGLLVWETSHCIKTAILTKSWREITSNCPEISRIIAKRFAYILVGGTPILLYDLWLVKTDPVLAGWNIQNITSAPPIWDLIISLSPVFWVAMVGAWLVLRKGLVSGRLLVVWCLLGFILVYLPFNLQRRFAMGLFIPFVGLVGYLLGEMKKRGNNRSFLILGMIFTLSIPTNLLILLTVRQAVQEHEPLIYLEKGEATALDWIALNTPEDALILASPDMGLFIPAHTGRRVIYGHPFETVNASREKAAVLEFFAIDTACVKNTSQEIFLKRRSVDYIYYGPRERQLGSLSEINGIEVVYSHDGVVIYQVVENP